MQLCWRDQNKWQINPYKLVCKTLSLKQIYKKLIKELLKVSASVKQVCDKLARDKSAIDLPKKLSPYESI